VLPRSRANMLIAVLGGLFLSLGGVFVVELVDDRIKTPDDARQQLKVEFLGLVPEVGPKRRRKGTRVSLLQEDVPALFSEAFRAMRTGVVSAAGEKGPKSVLVASAAEGEGKTLVASNLAIALARANQRVLLVDADMRRPTLHDIFGQRLEPGLSNVLGGTATLAEALRLTTVPGLTVVPAGTPTMQASELLGSAIFNELFEILQEHFVWVIIDSPPVLTVTDASIVARKASGVVFVLGCGMTTSRVARLAVDELQRLGGRVVGTVLNRADLHHHPFYFSPYSRGLYRAQAAPGRASEPKTAAMFGRRA
jgi:capsular exopolysaccharide synthesis family protein